MEDDSVIRFLVSTDNHLGFAEKDPVRCNDSHAAFEEVLRTAVAKKVDFILLAGDLFHENKPSRRAMHSTMELLRSYCLGSDPVYIEILNDQEEIFKASLGHVNYEDPFQSIRLPIFAIHGNHDDPSREGSTGEALAALDLLAMSNLINYFGKADRVEDIEIMPILLRKGPTKIALYGLGAIRDERLNRMWNQKKVKFVRLTEEQGRDEYFNLFLLHQNRDYGRGRKNCVHESMIPDWMDLVIWGNEHECQPQLAESLVGTYRILQPGSSIACSLSRGESTACPKHMAYFEVKERKFRMKPLRYRHIRQFVYDEVVLRQDYPDLNPNDPKIEEKIRDKLNLKVNAMIREARSLIENDDDDVLDNLAQPARFKIIDPQKVLIRLRVEFDGFPSINHQRFGSQYVGTVANPSEILLLARKRKETTRVEAHATHGDIKQIFADGVEEEINKIKIEDLVNDVLSTGKSSLSVLLENEMAKALDDFIFRKETDAIKEVVSNSLHRIQVQLSRDNVARNETVQDSVARLRHDLETNETLRNEPLGPRPARAAAAAMDMDIEDAIPAAPAKGRKTAVAKTTAAAKKPAATTGRKKAAAKNVDVDEDDSPATAPRKSSRATKSKKAPVIESEDDLEDEDVLEDSDASVEVFEDESVASEEVKPKRGRAAAAAPKASAKSAATSSSRARKTTAVTSSKSSARTEDDDVFEVEERTEKRATTARGAHTTTTTVDLVDDEIEISQPARAPPQSQQASQATAVGRKPRQLPLSFTQGAVKAKSSKTSNLASGWDD